VESGGRRRPHFLLLFLRKPAPPTRPIGHDDRAVDNRSQCTTAYPPCEDAPTSSPPMKRGAVLVGLLAAAAAAVLRQGPTPARGYGLAMDLVPRITQPSPWTFLLVVPFEIWAATRRSRCGRGARVLPAAFCPMKETLPAGTSSPRLPRVLAWAPAVAGCRRSTTSRRHPRRHRLGDRIVRFAPRSMWKILGATFSPANLELECDGDSHPGANGQGDWLVFLKLHHSPNPTRR